MRIVLIVLLFIKFSDGGYLQKTARINERKTAAEKAFKSHDYKKALEHYAVLTDSFKISDESILLNKAHCFYNLKDKDRAKQVYNTLSHAANKAIKSVANQQLGNLAYSEKNLDLAKNYFKSALKAHPDNNEARYNYELISRLLKKEEEKENKNQEDRKDQPPPQEPSLFAKKLKEQAEAMAGSYKYAEAYDLMMNGAKKDKSVLYYQEFIDRLKVVADLSKI